jgi:endonuclease I
MSDYGGFMKLTVLLAALFVANFAVAAGTSQKFAYYGEKFYNDIATGSKDVELRETISHVLESRHRSIPNEFDEIDANCEVGTKNCYSQFSIGYDGARAFLMGKYYLVDHGGGQYGVRDVYCNNEKTARDFKGGSGPGPNKIPNANVINTEHSWPQSKFGSHGRGFQKADLHHLFPTDSQANSTRGNFNFGDVAQDTKTVSCPASRFGRATDGTNNIFEPPANHKGNVARALFYFAVRYQMHINPSEEAYLRKSRYSLSSFRWKLHPVLKSFKVFARRDSGKVSQPE